MLALQAIGVCCQKVTEAEAMFQGGVTNLLLSNELIGIDKYERMAALQVAGANVTLIFDNALAIEQASKAAAAFNTVFDGALVEINVGQNRCGVNTKEEALILAKLVDASPYLPFRGLQACYLRTWIPLSVLFYIISSYTILFRRHTMAKLSIFVIGKRKKKSLKP
jgi:3-hydroxy-D-aspartate aldolase